LAGEDISMSKGNTTIEYNYDVNAYYDSYYSLKL
jgi:hypothetical protein